MYAYVRNTSVNAIDPTGMWISRIGWSGPPAYGESITVSAPDPWRQFWADFLSFSAAMRGGLLQSHEPPRQWQTQFMQGWTRSAGTVWQRFGEFNTPTNGLELAMVVIPGGKLTANFKHAVRALKIDSTLASRALHAAKHITGRGGADNVLFNKETGDIISMETGEIIGNLKDFTH